MEQRSSIFLCVFILLIVASCKKEQECASSFPGLRIKTSSTWKQGNNKGGCGLTTHCYDEQGRSIRWESNDCSVTWTYSDHTVYVKDMGGTSLFFLNEKGFYDSVYSNTRSSYAEHDNNGFLTRHVSAFEDGQIGSVSTYTVSDSNVVASTYTDSVNHKTSRYFVTFFLDKPNTIGYQNDGQLYLGSASKNLPERFYEILENGDTVLRGRYEYDFDNLNRVKTQRRYDESNYLETTNYTYY